MDSGFREETAAQCADTDTVLLTTERVIPSYCLQCDPHNDTGTQTSSRWGNAQTHLTSRRKCFRRGLKAEKILISYLLFKICCSFNAVWLVCGFHVIIIRRISFLKYHIYLLITSWFRATHMFQQLWQLFCAKTEFVWQISRPQNFIFLTQQSSPHVVVSSGHSLYQLKCTFGLKWAKKQTFQRQRGGIKISRLAPRSV